MIKRRNPPQIEIPQSYSLFNQILSKSLKSEQVHRRSKILFAKRKK